MSSWPSAFLCLLVAIAGWHYLFHSKAARHLNTIETSTLNARRVFLRRTNGALLLVLAALLYLGLRIVNSHDRPREFILLWLGALALLLCIVMLALIDLRLTFKLRASRPNSDSSQ